MKPPLALTLVFAGCGPTTVVVDDKPGRGSDTAADDSGLDSADTGSDTGSDTGTDTADSGDDTDDPDPGPQTGDCLEYGVVIDQSAHLASGSSFDSFDSTLGAYGGANVGSVATISLNGDEACALLNGSTVQGTIAVTGDPEANYCEEWGAAVSGGVVELVTPATFPVVATPDVGDNQGDVKLTWGGASTWNADARYEDVSVAGGSTLSVTRSAIVVVDTLDVAGTISIAEGERLDLYVRGTVNLGWGAAVNTAGSPGQLRIWVEGVGPVTLAYGSGLNAWVLAPEAPLSHVGTFGGALAVRELATQWGAATHLDTSVICP